MDNTEKFVLAAGGIIAILGIAAMSKKSGINIVGCDFESNIVSIDQGLFPALITVGNSTPEDVSARIFIGFTPYGSLDDPITYWGASGVAVFGQDTVFSPDVFVSAMNHFVAGVTYDALVYVANIDAAYPSAEETIIYAQRRYQSKLQITL